MMNIPIKMVAVIDQVAAGAIVRDHRKQKNITLEVLAEKIGWSRCYLSELERGRRTWNPITWNNTLKAIESHE
ncbi:MAG: helix-turn-helix transcriptional regulator [Armatimonadota bacterium]